MRTTLTLDPDVARLIDDAVHRERRPVKQVVNDALRRGLRPERPADEQPKLPATGSKRYSRDRPRLG